MTEQIEESLGFDWHKILAIGLLTVILGGGIASATGGGGTTIPIKRWLFSVSGTVYSVIKPVTGQTTSNTNPSVVINFAIGKAVTGDIFDFQGSIFKFPSSTGFISGSKSLTWTDGIFQTLGTTNEIDFVGPADGLTTMVMTDFTFNETSITNNLLATVTENGFLNPFFLNINLESNGSVASIADFHLTDTGVINTMTFTNVCDTLLGEQMLEIFGGTSQVENILFQGCSAGSGNGIRVSAANVIFRGITMTGPSIGTAVLDDGIGTIFDGLTVSFASATTAVNHAIGSNSIYMNSFFNGIPLSLKPTDILVNTDVNPKGPVAVTVGASPFTYTNNDNVFESVYLRGGAITTITKNGITLFGALAAGSPLTVDMYPAQSIIITYTVMPSMTADRF